MKTFDLDALAALAEQYVDGGEVRISGDGLIRAVPALIAALRYAMKGLDTDGYRVCELATSYESSCEVVKRSDTECCPVCYRRRVLAHLTRGEITE